MRKFFCQYVLIICCDPKYSIKVFFLSVGIFRGNFGLATPSYTAQCKRLQCGFTMIVRNAGCSDCMRFREQSVINLCKDVFSTEELRVPFASVPLGVTWQARRSFSHLKGDWEMLCLYRKLCLFGGARNGLAADVRRRF
jgi:hypothetical protein